MVGRNDPVEIDLVASPGVLDAPEVNPDLYRVLMKAGAAVDLKLLLGDEEKK